MCHQKLGNNEAALNSQELGNAAAEKFLSQPAWDNWFNRSRVELLRAEATKLIKGDK